VGSRRTYWPRSSWTLALLMAPPSSPVQQRSSTAAPATPAAAGRAPVDRDGEITIDLYEQWDQSHSPANRCPPSSKTACPASARGRTSEFRPLFHPLAPLRHAPGILAHSCSPVWCPARLARVRSARRGSGLFASVQCENRAGHTRPPGRVPHVSDPQLSCPSEPASSCGVPKPFRRRAQTRRNRQRTRKNADACQRRRPGTVFRSALAPA
jgi:hypothetical protein